MTTSYSANIQPLKPSWSVVGSRIYYSEKHKQLSEVLNEQGKKEVQELLDDLNKRGNSIVDRQAKLKKYGFYDASSKANQEVVEGLLRLGTELSFADTEASMLAGSVFNKAEQRRADSERRYKVAKYASNYLYVLGWGLALFGRLYAVDIDAGE